MCGKGLEAAVLTGKIRTTVQARVVNRPSTLDHMLELAGTHEYLTGIPNSEQRQGEPSG